MDVFILCDADQLRLRELFKQNVGFVTRLLRRAGIPSSDLDDEVQRTFIAFARRLDDVQQGKERSFLFNVARNVAMHARRAFARRREVPVGTLRDGTEGDVMPDDLIARDQLRNLLGDVLAALDESLRDVVVLHQLQGMDSFQIARLLAIPRGTVASRLRRARESLRQQIAATERPRQRRVVAPPRPKPTIVSWHESMSPLEQALLDVGRDVHATGLRRDVARLEIR
jgi:RNA polymerase sigma-70 factor (ECF subfamily)